MRVNKPSIQRLAPKTRDTSPKRASPVTRPNVFITGFSGAGKTTIGREAAGLLGWTFVDTDDEIVASQGMAIEEIFSRHGEDGFRRIERETIERVARADRQVVSTGGGIIMDERNRAVMEANGVVVLLEARPDTILRRLAEQRSQDDAAARPMLEAADLEERVRSLKALRQFNYTLAHWTVHTDFLTPADAAAEVVRGFEMVNAHMQSQSTAQDSDMAAQVRASSGDYPLWVGWDIIEELGERVRRTMDPAAAYIISDNNVQSQARRAQRAMESAGIPTHLFFIPPGEQSKTLETAQHIYHWLASLKAERGHLILAVGGGVVGDLAGFVAATYLRGVPYAQVPTSLLAMMDSAIGGKTAVDLPQGKNLVGAFYQPKFVLADVSTLQTLRPRELASGWAEAIKHGLIMDDSLLSTFESLPDEIQSLEPEIATDVIRRSMAIKADVVSQDEKETLGIRVLLNYGHTIGHAIEAVTGYDSYLHGEAVSVGMMGAANIGRLMGMTSESEVERQRAALSAYGLPLDARGVDPEAVSEAMLSDKKVSDGAIRWVLLDGIGNARTRNDVPSDVVRTVLNDLMN